MKRFLMAGTACMFAASALLIAGFAHQVDPHKALKELNDLRASRFAPGQQRTANEVMALNKEVVEKAKGFVKDVDAGKVVPKDGYAWAQLFSLAGMHAKTCEAAERFLTSNPAAAERFQAQILLLDSCAQLGEGKKIRMKLPEVTAGDKAQAQMLTSRAAYMYADEIAKSDGPEAALKVLEAVEAKIPFELFTTTEDKAAADGLRATFAMGKAEYMVAAHREKDAIKLLQDAVAKLDAKSPMLRQLNGQISQLMLLKSPPPATVVERGYGAFKGLDALKGKVVVLDFFAHWCGPCIASFPDMRQLYSDLKDKGLEVIGLTTYYGYYKTENREKRDMSKDVEFAKMQDFIREQNITWPVQYVDRSVFTAYGVTGIPTVVVIDKSGNVAKIKVGYSKDSFAEFRKAVEGLLK